MNYYIVTEEVFNTLTKENIDFIHHSNDRSEVLVLTTDIVSEYIERFYEPSTCSQYTFSNHSDWVGDGSGIEEWQFDKHKYIPEIDD